MSIEKSIQNNSDAGSEGTSYEDALRAAHRYRLSHWIIQTLIADDHNPYSRVHDDRFIWQVFDLEEQNALPDGVTAEDLIQLYESNYAQQRRNIH